MDEPMSSERLAESRAQLARAHSVVDDLTAGRAYWKMTIPADEARDSDLVLSSALTAAEELAAEVERLHSIEKTVTEFLAARVGLVRTLRECVEANGDYFRWQGHAEARRVLSQMLGWPVAWPAEDAKKSEVKP